VGGVDDWSRVRWKSDSMPHQVERRARKWYRCDSCGLLIMPGDLYLRCTDWPNWETNQTNRPVTYRIHDPFCFARREP
jgi:hypothetical protein